jgi:hypothetical protein
MVTDRADGWCGLRGVAPVTEWYGMYYRGG